MAAPGGRGRLDVCILLPNSPLSALIQPRVPLSLHFECFRNCNPATIGTIAAAAA